MQKKAPPPFLEVGHTRSDGLLASAANVFDDDHRQRGTTREKQGRGDDGSHFRNVTADGGGGTLREGGVGVGETGTKGDDGEGEHFVELHDFFLSFCLSACRAERFCTF